MTAVVLKKKRGLNAGPALEDDFHAPLLDQNEGFVWGVD